MHFLNRPEWKDKFTIRGLIYSTIGVIGMSYELIFRDPPELIVIFLYSAIIVIGGIAIFAMKETV